MAKTFIEVIAEHDREGRIKPLSITWADGRKYSIDKVLDVRVAASLKMGGKGLRYTCKIHGKQVFLFYDSVQWYVDL